MINLLEGQFMCCGTLCDKVAAQAEIDKMQAALVAALTTLTEPVAHDFYLSTIEQLKELTK